MEIWILIGILLAFGFIVGVAIEIYENVQMNRWMRKRHLRELKLAMKQLEHPEFFLETHTSGVTTTLPTGEVEELGPGKVYVFGGPKVGTITGIVSEEEMTDEAERLIKEAHNKRASALLESL